MTQLLRQLAVQINRNGAVGLLAKILSVLLHEGIGGIRMRILRMSPQVDATSRLIRIFDNPDEKFYANLTRTVRAWPAQPLISILMPIHDTHGRWLRQALDSVLNQAYPKWELCIIANASSQSQVKRILAEYQRAETRIKVICGDCVENTSAATNRGLAAATGGFAVLLRHDDLLERQALYRVAESIIADRPDIIYSDSVLIDAQSGEFVSHEFRPGFSAELLRSHPYIGNLIAFRTGLLQSIAGFNEGLSVSQDYDLVLRAVEHAKTIVHIPEVLYRRRNRDEPPDCQEQAEVMDTSRLLLVAHLERCGEKAEVRDGKVFNFFEVRYPLGSGIKVATIIPTKNHGDLLRQCIESIVRTVASVPYDIVVVDHDSDDPETLKYFNELSPRHRLLHYQGPFNFSAINNWAISQLNGEYSHYLLCNNDIEAIAPGWLERMLELTQKPDIGIVGAKLYYPDRRTVQHAGVCVGMFGMAEHYGKHVDKDLPNGSGLNPGYMGSLVANREVSAVTAACMLLRRDTFEWMGGFDENIKVGFGDVDLCLRARQAGYRVLFCPHAEMIHHESYSRGKSPTELDPHPEDTYYFARRWRQFIDVGDPYYNPNLSLRDTIWSAKGSPELALETGKRDGPRVYRKHPGFKEIYT